VHRRKVSYAIEIAEALHADMVSFGRLITTTGPGDMSEPAESAMFSCARGGVVRHNIHYQPVNVATILDHMVKLPSYRLRYVHRCIRQDSAL
jgi:hypothetical protein